MWLGDGLWRRSFGADPGIVGRKLATNGQSAVVVGVLPRDFQLPREADIWAPLVFSANDLQPENRGYHSYQVMARIKDGVSFEQARSDMDSVSTRIIEQHPEYPYKQFNFRVLMIPLLEQQVGDIKTALWVLMSAVGWCC